MTFFKKNIRIKKGYSNVSIYDFNTKNVYLVNFSLFDAIVKGDVCVNDDIIQKMISIGIMTNDVEEKESNLFDFSYELFDDAFSYERCKLIYLEVADYCNFKCKHCYAEMDNSKKFFTDGIAIKKIINNLKNYGECDIRITGGEPFTNPNIGEIIELISKEIIPKNTHSIATNGSFSVEDAIKAIELGFELQVSIYGMSRETFSQFTGAKKEIFDLLMNKLKALSKAGLSDKVLLAMSVNEINYNEIATLISFAKEYGFKYVLNRPASVGRALDNWNEIGLSNQHQIEFAKMQNKDIPSYCYHLCQLFWADIRVNGDVTPCPYIRGKEFVMGNIFNTSFEKIWGTRNYDMFRAMTASNVTKCKDCEFIYVCTAGCCAEALGQKKSILETYPWCKVKPFENREYLSLGNNQVVRVKKLAAGIFEFEQL